MVILFSLVDSLCQCVNNHLLSDGYNHYITCYLGSTTVDSGYNEQGYYN